MASAVHFSETFDRDNGSCRKRLKLLESDQCLLDTLERNLEVQFVSNSASLVILASSTGCCCCQATLQIQSYVHRLKPSRWPRLSHPTQPYSQADASSGAQVESFDLQLDSIGKYAVPLHALTSGWASRYIVMKTRLWV